MASTPHNAHKSRYRNILLNISEGIPCGDDSLKKLKYLCEDTITNGALETVKSPLQLIEELEKQGHLGVDNLDFFLNLLINTGFVKLASQLEDFKLQRRLHLLSLSKHEERCSLGDFKFEHGSNGEVYTTDGSVEQNTLKIPAQAQPTAAVKEDLSMAPCCYNCHYKVGPPPRLPGEIHLKLFLELAGKAAWLAGTGLILTKYINEPATLAGLFASVVLPSGILVKYLCKGSIVCVLEATELEGLRELWKRYNSGELKDALEKVLIDQDLRNEAKGREIRLKVEINEEMYYKTCWELITAKCEGKQIEDILTSSARQRRFSDPVAGVPPSQQHKAFVSIESFKVVAVTERERRQRVEKQLEKKKSLLESYMFPGPRLDKWFKEGQVDSQSDEFSSTSTFEEEEELQWEEDTLESASFWSSIEGSHKEKPFLSFESAVQALCQSTAGLSVSRENPEDFKALMVFLAYILKVDYRKREKEVVHLRNFMRLTRWFGPFQPAAKGCLNRIYDLMKKAVSLDEKEGKESSWFAGYTTEIEVAGKLQSEQQGTFLIWFNTDNNEFLLSRKSFKDVLTHPIEVVKNSGEVKYEEKRFPDLPSLVEGLIEQGMPLKPFFQVLHLRRGVMQFQADQQTSFERDY